MKKTNFFSNPYKKSFSFIYDIRKFIYFSVILFFVFLLIGFFVPAPASINDWIMRFLQEMAKRTENLSPL